MPIEAAIACPRCQKAAPLPGGAAWAVRAESECPRCRIPMTVMAFPRIVVSREANAAAGQPAREGEAVCKFYPGLQAEVVCDECGCLLSRKAAVDWTGRTLCFPCLHQLREKKGAASFSARRRLHDNTAIALVLFLAPFSFITAPIALAKLIRHRHAPAGIVPRGPFRWWLALMLSLAATAGWIILFIAWIALIVRAVTQ